MASMGVRFAAVVSLFVLVGCGSGGGFPKTYPVTGSIKLNGKPIEGCIVTFQLKGGKNAIGNTDSKGEFSLSMFRPNDGAVPGEYSVAVTKVDPAAVSAADTPPPGQIASGDLAADYAPPPEAPRGPAVKKSIIPAKYSNDQTSGLRATVSDSAPNHFDFELK